MVSRKLREKGRKLAAHLLEVSEEDIEFEWGKFFVKGAPDKAKTIQDVAFAAYTDFPDGMESGLEDRAYSPPNLTFPSAPTRWSSRSTRTPACGRWTAWSPSTTAACGSTR